MTTTVRNADATHSKNRPLRVVDLFCGAGGISAGLEMAGMKVVFGLDNNKDAIATFKANHPHADVYCGDIERFDLSTIPEFDVLVGGPPCVNFSTSKGGRANVLDGLKLVHAFLRLVHARSPKYWIMENVPRVALHLPDEIPLRWIGVDSDGFLEVPIRAEFNCADYGVPQTRKRYLIGKYPIPAPTHEDPSNNDLFKGSSLPPHRVINDVIKALPPYGSSPRGRVIDPTYGIQVMAKDLAHYHDADLSTDEAKRIRKAKEEHPFMGRMSFPDSWDRPARTIVATQMGRETMVFKGSRSSPNEGYRRPTISECAVLQTFPLCFQFWGATVNSRYRQAGNAVPPLLAFRIGRQIYKLLGHNVLNPIPYEKAPIASPPIESNSRIGSESRPLPATKGYKRLIPGKEVRGTRVQFENSFIGTKVVWQSLLYIGEGKANLQRITLESKPIALLLAESEKFDFHFKGLLDKLSAQAEHWARQHQGLRGEELQQNYIHRAIDVPTPDTICDWIRDVVEENLPWKQYRDTKISAAQFLPVASQRGIRVRILAAGYICSLLCDSLKSSDCLSRV